MKMSGMTGYRFDYKALTPFLDFIGSHHQDMVLQPSRGPVELFHYTDLAGLQGILQNHDLWLTNSRYSNDSEEMTHGCKVVMTILQNARTVDPVSQYMTRLEELTKQSEGVYVCCFCEKDNLLSQWRSYGANGTGVSVQVDPNGFSQLTGPDCPSGLLRFWRVFYAAEKQNDIIQKAIDYFAPTSAYQTPGQSPEACARKAAEAIQFFIPTFKNSDFSEEREWRLIFTPSSATTVNLRFRVSRNMLVPFYSLKELVGGQGALPLLPIKGLRVGPSVHKQLNVESACLLLGQNGYTNIPVMASDTPYRS
jgi:hypothetical protein